MSRRKEKLAAPPPLPKKRRLIAPASASKEIWYRPTITGWTPSKVEAARDQSETGSLLLLADLVETMHRDARIQGVLSTRTHGMLGLPLDFEGGSEAARTDLASKDDTSQVSSFWQMHKEAELAKLLRWGLLCGVGLAQIVELPRTAGKKHRYHLDVWSPRWLQYYHYGSGNGGSRWRVQTQNGMEDVVAGDGKWVLFLPYGARRPWSEGLWNQLSFPWLLKHYSMEDRANFGEALGSPIWVGNTKHGGTEKQRNKFLAELKNMGKNGKLVLPEGWELKLVEASSSGKSGDVFSQQIKDSNEEITIALAGQLVTTEGMSGFSNGSVQENIHQNLLRFDAKRLSECLHDQTLGHWSLYNYQDRSAAPWPKWQTEKPEDMTEKADGLNKLGEAVSTLNTAIAQYGMKVDVPQLLKQFNIPVLNV